jgi:hypothetical protein
MRREVPQGLKGGSLVALLKRVRSSDASHQRYAKSQNVFLPETEKVLRARHSAFQQSTITNEMPLARCFDFEAISFDYRLDGQPIRLIWQGQPECLEIAP